MCTYVAELICNAFVNYCWFTNCCLCCNTFVRTNKYVRTIVCMFLTELIWNVFVNYCWFTSCCAVCLCCNVSDRTNKSYVDELICIAFVNHTHLFVLPNTLQQKHTTQQLVRFTNCCVVCLCCNVFGRTNKCVWLTNTIHIN